MQNVPGDTGTWDCEAAVEQRMMANKSKIIHDIYLLDRLHRIYAEGSASYKGTSGTNLL